MPDYWMFQLVSDLYEVVPAVLGKTGKVKNPWPNVDAHSGVLLQHYDIVEENFYTVLFGVSRGLGVLSHVRAGQWLGCVGGRGLWSAASVIPVYTLVRGGSYSAFMWGSWLCAVLCAPEAMLPWSVAILNPGHLH